MARFGEHVAVLHSELRRRSVTTSGGASVDGETWCVIGARSAVFAPVRDLGLLVVDEEHEGSYKQEEGPRYNGRDVAVVRARLEGAVRRSRVGNAIGGIPTTLKPASTSPSRSHVGSDHRGYRTVSVVDRRKVRREAGTPCEPRPRARPLKARLGRGEQALLLLNRRGFATSLLCRECGDRLSAPTARSRSRCTTAVDPICHYCGHKVETARKCASCGGVYLKLSGYGTEKVAERSPGLFPGREWPGWIGTPSRDGEPCRQTLASFEAGDIDILLGTQMIAKGHDFPTVTLVGVVDADVGLGLPDFRSAERPFPAERGWFAARRGGSAGEAIIQTVFPGLHIELACPQDYPAGTGIRRRAAPRASR